MQGGPPCPVLTIGCRVARLEVSEQLISSPGPGRSNGPYSIPGQGLLGAPSLKCGLSVGSIIYLQVFLRLHSEGTLKLTAPSLVPLELHDPLSDLPKDQGGRLGAVEAPCKVHSYKLELASTSVPGTCACSAHCSLSVHIGRCILCRIVYSAHFVRRSRWGGIRCKVHICAGV